MILLNSRNDGRTKRVDCRLSGKDDADAVQAKPS